VASTPIDVYVASFVGRCELMRCPDRAELDVPGLRGLLASSQDPRIRLLVTDDRAYDALAALLPDARAGMVRVFEAASGCAELWRRGTTWEPGRVTAMICRDLETVPAFPLPSELTLRAVRRLDDDPPDGVSLEEAVAVATGADPTTAEPPDALADLLRSMPSAIRLFAAIDDNGTVRATSGSGTFGADATVLFVNTEPGWRRRGIGRAMTAAALHAARLSGARRACLDSSDAGATIYLQLGFEIAGRMTRFFQAA
jgi:GNAT superfamily N-acetyltransferase